MANFVSGLEFIKSLEAQAKIPSQTIIAGDQFEHWYLGLMQNHGKDIHSGFVHYYNVNDNDDRKILRQQPHRIEIRGSSKHARGIDGVLQTLEGYILVQIKIKGSRGTPNLTEFYREREHLKLPGILITTTDFDVPHENIRTYNRKDVLRWMELYGWEFPSNIQPQITPEIKLRGDQGEILTEAKGMLETLGECLMNLAPGYGKTILSILLAHDYPRVVVVAPVLDLVGQHRKVWLPQVGTKPILTVCSRSRSTLEGTTDSEKIEKFHQKLERLTFVTYESLDLLESFHFDLVVYDEAHNLSSELWGQKFPKSRKLFATATITNPPTNAIIRRSLIDSINRKMLSDFEFVMAEFSCSSNDMKLGTMAQLILQSVEEYGCRKMMVFGSRHENNKIFEDILTQMDSEGTVKIFRDESGPYKGRAVEDFEACSGPCLLLSVRKFIQGLNLPACDSVCVLYPGESQDNWTQMIGRAIRLDHNNPNKLAKILLPIPIETRVDSIQKVVSSRYENCLRVIQCLELDKQDELHKQFLLDRTRILKYKSNGSSRGIFKDVDEEVHRERLADFKALLIRRTKICSEYERHQKLLRLYELKDSKDYYNFQKDWPELELPDNPEFYYANKGLEKSQFTWSDYLSVAGDVLSESQTKTLFEEFLGKNELDSLDFVGMEFHDQDDLWTSFEDETIGVVNIDLDRMNNLLG